MGEEQHFPTIIVSPSSAALAGSTEAVQESENPQRPTRTPTAALGWIALAIAALCVIADVVAVVLAAQRSWETATLIAQASNLSTVIAFVAGVFAVGSRPSRALGIVAMVLAVLANPFVLTHLLAFLAGS